MDPEIDKPDLEQAPGQGVAEISEHIEASFYDHPQIFDLSFALQEAVGGDLFSNTEKEIVENSPIVPIVNFNQAPSTSPLIEISPTGGTASLADEKPDKGRVEVLLVHMGDSEIVSFNLKLYIGGTHDPIPLLVA